MNYRINSISGNILTSHEFIRQLNKWCSWVEPEHHNKLTLNEIADESNREDLQKLIKYFPGLGYSVVFVSCECADCGAWFEFEPNFPDSKLCYECERIPVEFNDWD